MEEVIVLAKRIFAFICACFLALSVLSVSAEETVKNENIPDGYNLIESNGGMKLYADMKTGDFAIFDESAKRIWYSGQNEVLDSENPISQLNFGRVKTDLVSMIALNYVQVSTIASTAVPLYQNSYAYCVTEGNVTVEKISGGYRADYYFADLETTIPVEVILENGKLKVSILGSKIKLSDTYRITSISLLPGFLAGDERNEGYLFVPSGSGALVPFATGMGDVAVYSEMVYGDDTAIEQEEYDGEKQNIKVPVYGVKSGSSAITAIITESDGSAKITAEADSLTASFTRVYSEYITSIIDETTLFESNYENQRIIYGAEDREKLLDYSVEYTFLNGENANYSGMAEVYRNYLNLEKKPQKPSISLTFYGAAKRKASFLGIPYTKTMSLTSFKDTQKIIEEFNENDISVSLRYVGWNNDGIDNRKIASKFSPVSALGGKNQFEKLNSYLEKADAKVFFDIDFIHFKKSGNGFSLFSNVCKSIFNTRTPIYEYMRSVYVPVSDRDPSYLLTPEAVKEVSENFFNKYRYGKGISVGDLGSILYSDFKGGKERTDCINSFIDILKNAEKKYEIALCAPNAYTFEYTDSIYDIPMCNDGNLLFSQSVPFLQLVLHGYVPYSAESDCDLLDCIEYGANPAFFGIYSDSKQLIETDYNWLYGSTYNNWKDDAIKFFKEYNDVYSELSNCVITKHSNNNGISETVFENGTVIYVNRNETEYKANGITVPPMGYKVIGGGLLEKE